ncbi:MAG: hypothetical protein KDB88_02740 [Flavobacteriales bacterium]|nr:hypothetical protein [Flavobacteriales bacterium]
MLRTLARWSGGLLVAFLVFMLVGHVFGEEGALTFSGTGDGLAFLCFPIGLAAGLALAYWKPLPGGLLATTSLMVLFILRPDLMSQPMFWVFLVPGILHILGVVLSKRV